MNSPDIQIDIENPEALGTIMPGLAGQEALAAPVQQVETSPPETPAQPAAMPQRQGENGEDDLSFFDYVKDTVKGIANGPVNSVNETIDLAGTILQGGEEFDVVQAAKERGVDMENFGKTQTTAGKIAEDFSTFISGFLTGGAILKGIKALQGSGRGVAFARDTVKSAWASVASFDAHADTLAGMLQESGTMHNVVTEALAVSKDDASFTAYLKRGLEDVGLGLALGAAGRGVKALAQTETAKEMAEWISGVWKASKAATPEARDRIIAETVEGIAQSRSAAEALETTVVQAGEPLSKVKPRDFDSIDNNFLSAETVENVIPARIIAPKDATPFGNTPDVLLKPKGEAVKAIETEFTPDAKLLHENLTGIVNRSANMDEVLAHINEDYNLRVHVAHSEEGYKLLEHVNDLMREKTLKGQGPETLASVVEQGEKLKWFGMEKMQDYIAEVAEGKIPLHEASKTIGMLKNSMEFLNREILRISRKLEFNPASVSIQEKLDYVFLKKNIENVYQAERNLATEAGRLLNAHKISEGGFSDRTLYKWYAAPRNLNEEQISNMLAAEGWSDRMLGRMAKETVRVGDNLGAVARLARDIQPTSKLGLLNEFRINNMLSGPFTHTTGVATSFAKSMLMPAERYLAGAFKGDAAMRQEAADTLTGFFRYFNDSMRLMRKSFNTEEAFLDRFGSKLETNTAQMTYDKIRAMMLQDKPAGTELSGLQENIARMMGFVGPYLRLPSRLLLGTDEFFKQVNYRASLDAALAREAREAGMKNADEIRRYVDERMAQAFNPDGTITKGVFSDDVVKKHLQYAREATWTQDLGRDTIAGWYQSGANAHPVIRLVTPFVKTPANLFRDFVAHTPGLANMTRQYNEAVKAGGEEAALAQAKVATGMVMWGGAVMLAGSGAITGTPPRDPKLRAALEATGWQPYSIKIGDKYYAYRRLDPAGMFLGIAADLAVASQELTEEQYNEAASMAAVAMVKNVTSKTYMQGISELIDFLNNPDEKAAQYFGRMGSTFVPFASGLRFVRQQVDDPMREMRDFMDYTINTIPGFSDNLPARRNWVTGETVNYAIIGRDKNDMVLDELNRMADGMYGPPARKLHGVELSPAQYSRLNELHGTLTIGGKTLYDSLAELFSDPQYDIERNMMGDPPDKERGPRATAINRIVSAYRQQAQDELLREDMELHETVRQSDYQRLMSKRGQMTRENQRELLDALKDY